MFVFVCVGAFDMWERGNESMLVTDFQETQEKKHVIASAKNNNNNNNSIKMKRDWNATFFLPIRTSEKNRRSSQ